MTEMPLVVSFEDKAETHMNSKIKIIEDLSLNAWPSHQMQIYDDGSSGFLFLHPQDQLCGADWAVCHSTHG